MVTYGVSVNTAGWEKHDHQETGMDGALSMPQLSGIHKDQQRENGIYGRKESCKADGISHLIIIVNYVY